MGRITFFLFFGIYVCVCLCVSFEEGIFLAVLNLIGRFTEKGNEQMCVNIINHIKSVQINLFISFYSITSQASYKTVQIISTFTHTS